MQLLNQGEFLKKVQQQKAEDATLVKRKEKLQQEILFLESKKKHILEEINNLTNNTQ